MKTEPWKALLMGVCLALTVAFVSASCGGCKNPETSAYQIERTTRVTVEAAMGAWNEYVKTYHPPVSEELKVQAAFDKYKAAQVLLLDAAIGYKTASTSTNSTGEQEASKMLQVAVDAAADARTDLISLLRTFKLKL